MWGGVYFLGFSHALTVMDREPSASPFWGMRSSLDDQILPFSLICRGHILRSASALLLQQPPATTVLSSHAFPVAAPSVWNSLNIHTRSAETFLTIKSRLKTELFTASYDT